MAAKAYWRLKVFNWIGRGPKTQWQRFLGHAEGVARQPIERERDLYGLQLQQKESKENETLIHMWRHNQHGRALWAESQDWNIAVEQDTCLADSLNGGSNVAHGFRNTYKCYEVEKIIKKNSLLKILGTRCKEKKGKEQTY